MKRIALLLVFAFAAVSAFGQVFPHGDEIVEAFWQRGSYIKVVKDSKNIVYYSKFQVCCISIDENDMEISTLGYNSFTGKNNSAPSFGIRSWNITSDENGNIIITSKKNK